MRLLVFNHHFEQDIDALRYGASKHEIRVVSYKLLYRLAQKHFPEPVFKGLEEYCSPEYADVRQEYATEARHLLREIYCTFPFDVVISPSDTFFYIRAWVTAAREMGIPFVVLQKETTISPFSMMDHAQLISRTVPFISDLMLVCSEHHKQFWLNAGADRHKINVTGQPRFDFYRQPHRWQTWHDLGISLPQERPTVIFFSYDLGAYSPEGILAPIWTELRTDTEDVLIDLARQGHYNVLIKPHPQQKGLVGDEKRLRAKAGDEWGRTIQLLRGALDTRQLIVNTQAVVGFQTTALFEAMLGGKKVVYTFWSETVHDRAASLIPFHNMEDALAVAHSPRELRELLLSGIDTAPNSKQMQSRQWIFEKYLGSSDGRATERALQMIEGFTADSVSQIDEEAIRLRRLLDEQVPICCRRELRRAYIAAMFWRIFGGLGLLGYPMWIAVRTLRRWPQHRLYRIASYKKYRSSLSARRCQAVERVKQYQSTLNQFISLS